MRSKKPWFLRSSATAVLAAGFVVASLLPWAPPASAYPTDEVEFVGHGWGHGRGMGQYGALGYALNHGASWVDILNHFYSNTTMGGIGNPVIKVRLTKFDGLDTIVVQEKGQLLTNASPTETFTALRAQRIGVNTFRVEKGPGCGGPWSLVNPSFTDPSGVIFRPIHFDTEVREEMIQVCEPPPVASRWLRGEVRAVEGDGSHRTINLLHMENYLRGVVPRESPASWGDLGGGQGMHALRAQSVAARSYAAAEDRYSYAQTCDTTACQVYKGRAVQDASGFRDLEDPRTDAAITDTAQQARLFGSAPARTEFSSSTGGWTAGGTFPAVVDAGDSINLNPNHNWAVSIPVSTIESKWPTIGTLVSIFITKRNGLGDWGGRVLEVTIQGTSGSVTQSGDQVRIKLGLKSNWFNIIYPGGYWIAASDGAVYAYGSAPFYGSAGAIALARPVVGMTSLPKGNGYWLVASDGGIFSYGGAKFFGSTGAIKLNRPVVGMAATPTGNGYWLVASDGGIFAFGDAKFFGSTGNIALNQPVVGMAATPTGNGYWLVASDGGIFAFGDAKFYGSTGAIKLNRPAVGMAATPTGKGYWLVASDGGIFAFGDAKFFGSTGSLALDEPVVGMAATPTGFGYWLVAADGGVFTFGDAGFFGAAVGEHFAGSIVELATHPVDP